MKQVPRFVPGHVSFLIAFLCISIIASAQQTVPITGPQGDPTKGPVIIPPPANNPPVTVGRHRDNKSHDDNPNNPPAPVTPERVAQAQRRLQSLRDRYAQLDLLVGELQRNYRLHEMQGAAAGFEFLKQSNEAKAIAIELGELTAREAGVQALVDMARKNYASVMGRIYAELEQSSELKEINYQVPLARAEREEARNKALLPLKQQERYQAASAEKTATEKRLAQLRTAVAADPDAVQLEIKSLSAKMLQCDATLFDMEKPVLQADERFQQADAVFDAVTKRYNLVRFKIDEEFRNNPQRISVQKLLDDSIDNVTLFNDCVRDIRERLNQAAQSAGQWQQSMRDHDTARALRMLDISSALQERIAVAAEINRLENFLADAGAP